MTYPAHEETPKKRSGGLTALGILNIVFGALYVCGGIVGLAITALMPLADNPLSQMQQDVTSTGLTILGSVVSVVLAVGLIAAGIGLLKVLGWGRRVSLWVAGLMIFWTLLSFFINMIYVFPRMTEMSGLPEEAGQVGVVGAAVGGAIGTVCNLIYPVIVLVLLNTESMKKQFPPPQSPGEGNWAARTPT